MAKSTPFKKSSATMIIAICAVCAGAWRTEAETYAQTDLVSDIQGLATVFDPELVNSWGLTSTPTSPFWISDQGTSVATLYAVTDSTNVSKVAPTGTNGNIQIPFTSAGPQGPTGAVANTTSSFPVGGGGNGGSAHFIFANLNGTISAWDAGQTAFTQVTTLGAMYTGLAISQNQTQPLLYAANGTGIGSIDVFSSSFAPVNLGPLAFTDPNLPAGLVPFNVQDINGFVYVTYAPAGHMAQSTAGLGQGVVDVFNENGGLIQRLITGGSLAAPWGIALAPLSFGQFGGDLLIGNFSYSNSFIGAYDPTNGTFEGMIPIKLDGNSPGGLWALVFGNMGNNGSPNTLYFTDGINGEMDGLFGAINATTPLPATLPLFASGLGALGLLGWRRKRKAAPPAPRPTLPTRSGQAIFSTARGYFTKPIAT